MSVEVQILILAALVAAAVLAGAYAVFGRSIEKKETTQKRLRTVSGADKRRAAAEAIRSDPDQKRRKAVQQQLKELEKQQKAKQKRVSTKVRLERAGLPWSPLGFHAASGVLGLVTALFLLVMEYSPLVALLGGVAMGFGVPRWILGILAKRRLKRFGTEFVNAIDIIVRGIRSGIPVNECLAIIARECRPPVSEEFQTVVAGQKVGVTVEQSLERMLERIPTPELNFFMIVLAIQQKTGGNLAEALSNLSTVLRERKKMRGKIQSMSSEAKASAMIIGSLPILVMLAINFLTPDYLTPLFEERAGNIMLIGSAMWMATGILVMRKLIHFDF